LVIIQTLFINLYTPEESYYVIAQAVHPSQHLELMAYILHENCWG